MKSLSGADNVMIRNERLINNPTEKIPALPDEMIALVHFGRSGTGLLHSLIDGHENVSTLPSIYFSEFFDHANWTKLISDGWDGIIDRFTSIYDVLFNAKSSVPVETKNKMLLHNIGIKEGMANVGKQKNEEVRVDKDLFRDELRRLMNTCRDLDAFSFFKLVHCAYNAAINDHNYKKLIFYHIHNPDNCAQLNFARFCQKTKWIIMVRDPLQSCESWAKRDEEKNDYIKK